MKTMRIVLGAVGLLLCGAYLSYALQPTPREEPRPEKPERGVQLYHVTPWPADSAGRPYHEHVEEHINRLATQGWLFKTVLVGQREKMMVFERSVLSARGG